MDNMIETFSFKTVCRPLKTTFATSLGSKTVATSVLVAVGLAGGARGLGEVPTSFVLKHETPQAIGDILSRARPMLLGLPIGEYQAVLASLRQQFPQFHMTLSGLEMALFRGDLAARGITELQYWRGMGVGPVGSRVAAIPAARRASVSPARPSVRTLGEHRKKNHGQDAHATATVYTDITIPFTPRPEILGPWLARALAAGFFVYKVKVSGDVQADIAFVERVQSILADRLSSFTIRLDGNQGYSVKSFLQMADAVGKKGLAVELFEQPLPKDDHRGLAQVAARSPLPIILDETVFCPDDCRRVIDGRLGQGVNIKIAKSGIAQSAAILTLCRQAGLKLMIGCMTETMVGLSAGLALAAGTAAFDYIDLDSIHFMFHRKRWHNIEIQGPRYAFANDG
jgi:L-alanine-DL-glutamate epimerase-like enolase superfamily enzyme